MLISNSKIYQSSSTKTHAKCYFRCKMNHADAYEIGERFHLENLECRAATKELIPDL